MKQEVIFDSQFIEADPKALAAFGHVFGGSKDWGADSAYHIFAVAQFPRAKEDRPCDPIITPYPMSNRGQHEHWRPQNPSSRRDGLVMLLGSEAGDWLELRVFQTKGYMFQELAKPTFEVAPFPRIQREPPRREVSAILKGPYTAFVQKDGEVCVSSDHTGMTVYQDDPWTARAVLSDLIDGIAKPRTAEGNQICLAPGDNRIRSSLYRRKHGGEIYVALDGDEIEVSYVNDKEPNAPIEVLRGVLKAEIAVVSR